MPVDLCRMGVTRNWRTSLEAFMVPRWEILWLGFKTELKLERGEHIWGCILIHVGASGNLLIDRMWMVKEAEDLFGQTGGKRDHLQMGRKREEQPRKKNIMSQGWASCTLTLRDCPRGRKNVRWAFHHGTKELHDRKSSSVWKALIGSDKNRTETWPQFWLLELLVAEK